MKTLKLITNIILLALLADFAGWVAWVGSSQTPTDGFYLGRITVEILKVVSNIIN